MTKVQRGVARHYNLKPFRMQNEAPIVSITFDDAPDSAYTNGASILEERGIHGTYYIAAGTCDTQNPNWHVITKEHVRKLHERGHEIGCHTYSHKNVEMLDSAALDEECRKNHDALRRLCGDIQLTNFAYPYGGINLKRKLEVQKRFDTCRGIFEGVNAGKIDLGLLKVVAVYHQTFSVDKLQRFLRKTCDNNGWLIFYTHDVVEPPGRFGCSPAMLRTIVDTVKSMGLTCVPVRDALKLIGYPSR